MRLARACGVVSIVPLVALRAQTSPIVDHHQHFFSPATAQLVSSAANRIEPITGRDLVALLDSAGIQRAIVLAMGYTWGNPSRNVENEYEKVKAENDWTSQQVAPYPTRLRAFCSFNPIKAYALEELERCTNDPQLRFGLKLHIGNSAVDYHNAEHIERLRRVLRMANEHRMPIIVHMRASISQRLAYGRDEAMIFIDSLLPSAPDVYVQIAHLAGAGGWDDPAAEAALSVFTEALAKKDPRTRRLYFEVSGVALPESIPVTTKALVARRIREIGVDRVLFGSDAAVGGNTPARAWAWFRRLPLTEAEFRTIATNVAPYARW